MKVLIIFLTADGIPDKVGVVFAKGVFSWFCHFQENQGVLGLKGGNKNDPFPNFVPLSHSPSSIAQSPELTVSFSFSSV